MWIEQNNKLVREYEFENFREAFKLYFTYISSFFNWIKFFDSDLLKNNFVYYFVKYIGVFIFVLWILFESIFLRFYLVDEMDNRITQKRF